MLLSSDCVFVGAVDCGGAAADAPVEPSAEDDEELTKVMIDSTIDIMASSISIL